MRAGATVELRDDRRQAHNLAYDPRDRHTASAHEMAPGSPLTRRGRAPATERREQPKSWVIPGNHGGHRAAAETRTRPPRGTVPPAALLGLSAAASSGQTPHPQTRRGSGEVRPGPLHRFADNEVPKAPSGMTSRPPARRTSPSLADSSARPCATSFPHMSPPTWN